MPVSPLPCLTPLLLIAVPLLFLFAGKKAFLRAAGASLAIVALLLLAVFGPGWWHGYHARRGDAHAQFRYARWRENHADSIGAFLPWFAPPDVEGGYTWLKNAADRGDAEAMYVLGVRLKYGLFVPGGEQPAAGQALIDRALGQGFRPAPVREDQYYWRVFRENGASD